jgi:hypothetical protein
MWAFAPWDNDQAADWFGDFMDGTQIRQKWLAGIKADPMDSPEVVRAAAALFIMLGRVYVWPIKTFDEDLELSIASLSQVAANEEFAELPELVAAIQQEVAELKTRRKPASAPDSPAPSPIKPWWKLW